MIANWPTSLPRPERSSWKLQPMDARRKRQGDSGPPGYRRRFSSVPRFLTMSLVLTHDQRAVFDNFFHDTCQEGAISFWMPDPSNDGWPLTRESGEPLLVNALTQEPLTISARWLCAWGDELPVETVVQQVRFQKTFGVVVLP